VHEVSVSDWEQILRVNQTGVMLGMRAATALMLGNGPLSIINISSIWGQVAGTGQIAYHASKGAVINMTRNAAVTYAKQGIRANVILPGLIDTEMVRVQKPEMNAATLSLTPMGRIGLPEEIAAGVLFLASDESSFVTGVVLPIDGGYTAQ
jgi:NAD(P)-dependent dehydrogenase (short-subunit alcohol dehydrogenase family)